MLHQIFEQHPASFSAQILEKFEDKGDKLLRHDLRLELT